MQIIEMVYWHPVQMDTSADTDKETLIKVAECVINVDMFIVAIACCIVASHKLPCLCLLCRIVTTHFNLLVLDKLNVLYGKL